MIQEEYVTFPTAKLIEKAGFPQDGYLTYYNENGTTLHSQMPCAKRHARCTKYQAMRWLRKEKALIVNIFYNTSCDMYYYDIYACGCGWVSDDGEDFLTYEAAAEAGIQAACKYLIEKGDIK